MTDPLREWLRLQIDLGGDEVILDRPLVGPTVPRATTDAESITSASDSAASAADPAPLGGWRKNAPSIPGPGLDVVSDPALLERARRWLTLDEIAADVRVCLRCPLCKTRTHAVPGDGNPQARLMLIGEGPGESEDLSGRPFVGRAGVMLDQILANIEVPRADAFIANVVKCRPPRNRVPLPDEREACMPYLRRQIELVRPRVLLTLGGTAAEALLGVKASLGQLRLKVHRWNGIPLIVTYHPAALLRNPNWKRPTWDDVRIARQLLDRDP